MASLCTARLALQVCRRRTLLLSPTLKAVNSFRGAVTAANRKLKDGETFWNKNNRMSRPLSPHVMIYKFELPAMLSISHRATGIVMTGVTVAVAVCSLVLPNGIMYYLELIKNLGMPNFVFFSAKCLLVWPFWYHVGNGLRHLAWDTGRGFDMRVLYKTGYTLLLFSFLATGLSMAYLYS